MDYPRTLEEAKAYRYGRRWSGTIKAYVEGHCAYKVPDTISRTGHQCYLKNGHGPADLYCKQHAKMVAE